MKTRRRGVIGVALVAAALSAMACADKKRSRRDAEDDDRPRAAAKASASASGSGLAEPPSPKLAAQLAQTKACRYGAAIALKQVRDEYISSLKGSEIRRRPGPSSCSQPLTRSRP